MLRQKSKLLPELQFSLLVQTPGTSFLQLSELGMPWGPTVVRAQLKVHSQQHSIHQNKQTGLHSSIDKFSCLAKGKPVMAQEFPIWDLLAQTSELCNCTTLT